MLGAQALLKAQDFELDLVEVSPEARPPVCKIMDYGKHVYQTQKKQKKVHSLHTKELRLRPRIDDHDLDVKLNHAKKFLKEGRRVQFVVMLKGRELAHRDLGEKLLSRVVEMLKENGDTEKNVTWDKRAFRVMIFPLKSNKISS